ncbi:uncharacterized protein YdaU (DUF1376 family) [Roseimicrobium gellanilyticum]|uniref:Uncharacterized protein YdaU (DUF1376 family) n=1 Tax=Roseimicrobium gellanilyticum TaxID=748857 RepID=A0A366H626_9BACT|nr:DUF1376 domain-containing protein [Roseimicrobium gellanilyticum]RBP36921.1 uncharacterized protein YdaU (DUF1376 family) [Roseimicrobium gellanilyticum]
MPCETQELHRDAPAFDFYCERWTHGTRHLTKVERCDYLDLLLHQWTNDGLPADLDLLARLVGYRKGSQISPLVLEKFPVAADGKRRNVRLETERVKQRDRIRSKRQGAAKTNERRWGSKAGKGRVPSQNESHSDAISSRIATRSATIERHDIESPPLTTHHPPGDPDIYLSVPPEGAGWPKTEDQCRSMAAVHGVDPEYAATVWNQHESTGDYTQKDQHGNARPILKFASYLKFRWNCRSRRNDDAKALEKTKAELRRQGMTQKAPPSAHMQSRDGGTVAAGVRASARDVRTQRSGEIPTDVSMDKVKVYRLEDCEHE